MPSSRVFPTQGWNLSLSCLLHWQVGHLVTQQQGLIQIRGHTPQNEILGVSGVWSLSGVRNETDGVKRQKSMTGKARQGKVGVGK